MLISQTPIPNPELIVSSEVLRASSKLDHPYAGDMRNQDWSARKASLRNDCIGLFGTKFCCVDIPLKEVGRL